MTLFVTARRSPTGSDAEYRNLDLVNVLVSAQDPGVAENAANKWYLAGQDEDGIQFWFGSAAGYADKATAQAAIVSILSTNLLS